MKPNPAPDLSENASKARLRLWLRLLKVTQSTEAELRRRLRDEHGTTLPRFDVMAALARHPDGLKMSELSTYLRVSNGNVTGIVDRLVEDGLVLRVAVKGDRRAQMARLTHKGVRNFEVLARDHESWLDECLAALTPEDAALLRETLSKVDLP